MLISLSIDFRTQDRDLLPSNVKTAMFHVLAMIYHSELSSELLGAQFRIHNHLSRSFWLNPLRSILLVWSDGFQASLTRGNHASLALVRLPFARRGAEVCLSVHVEPKARISARKIESTLKQISAGWIFLFST